MKADRVLAIAHKEWSEIVRDRIFLALAFAMPSMLMLVFGHGMSQDVRNMPLVVVDDDRTEASRAYASRFAHSEHFDFKGFVASEREAARLLLHSRARVVVIVPRGFGDDLARARPTAVRTLIDGSFTSTRPARTIEGYVDAINAAATAELQTGYVARRLGIDHARASSVLRPLELELRYLYNPELRSDWSIAPALIMFVLIFAAPMLMALSVVREKESGSIFNVYASTVSRGEFLAGKLLPSVAISSVNAVILWLIAVLHFGAPFKGSMGCLALATLFYVFCTTGLGLLISLIVGTQQAALMIVGVMASILGFQYSGMIMPVASLAGLPWLIAHAFPPMYYLEILEGTFLKGMGLAGLWPSVLVLFGFAVAYLASSHALFHKRTRR